MRKSHYTFLIFQKFPKCKKEQKMRKDRIGNKETKKNKKTKKKKKKNEVWFDIEEAGNIDFQQVNKKIVTED